ncbi:MAG: 6-carboxytetrahydropterin synthase [Elusimicrobiaceae bacterium]
MYKIKKTFTISASHQLKLNYESPCSKMHGHNWTITVYCRRSELDQNGMVVDFGLIKKLVTDKFDHASLNEKLDCNPTAEHLAQWIAENVPFCYKADVEEAPGSLATYEEE